MITQLDLGQKLMSCEGHPVFTLFQVTMNVTTKLDISCSQTIVQISGALAACVFQEEKNLLTLLCFIYFCHTTGIPPHSK